MHSEDEYIRDFLNTNKHEIKEIFLAVHSPKEFKDISIRGGKIILERNNGDKTDLMRISTGQRSAIALSLFLTLNNKLRNGPPMIIFDDPVAFTDDLNILSFLDHLREVVFNSEENKQLFFATANENLSYLFQKKFEVLGEEFNHIYLER
jgi:exonuclease SbcC